jgi:uncharacterized protein YqhQ
MKSSNIGGQALIEGIMMRSGDEYSVAVRTPDQQIVVKKEPFHSIVRSKLWKKIPVVRGVISFIDSLAVGFGAMFYSASFYDDEPEQKELSEEEKNRQDAKDQKVFFGVFLVSFVAAILLFVLLPYYVSMLIGRAIPSHFAVTMIEAVLRIAIFLVYLALMTRIKDVNRTFMYHGAEHKCINCIEHGMPLTVENVMKSSRFHRRCGTSFLVIVVILSALILMLVQTDSTVLRVAFRLILIPLIAGLSFELLQYTGSHDNRFVDLIVKPGIATQHLTTAEPDESMVEVAIAAVEEVFDWRAYLQREFGADV